MMLQKFNALCCSPGNNYMLNYGTRFTTTQIIEFQIKKRSLGEIFVTAGPGLSKVSEGLVKSKYRPFLKS